jgi:hypothetical protein
MMAGKTPAFAESECAEARAWVEKNRDRLPESYDDVVAYTVAYRKAIYSAQSPRVRSALWVEHLRRYRATHPGLSVEQAAIVDRVSTVASDESVFSFGEVSRSQVEALMNGLKKDADLAFGLDESYAVFGTLGPSRTPDASNAVSPLQRGCTCTAVSDYCTNSTHCEDNWDNCAVSALPACGFAWMFRCTGLCIN